MISIETSLQVYYDWVSRISKVTRCFQGSLTWVKCILSTYTHTISIYMCSLNQPWCDRTKLLTPIKRCSSSPKFGRTTGSGRILTLTHPCCKIKTNNLTPLDILDWGIIEVCLSENLDDIQVIYWLPLAAHRLTGYNKLMQLEKPAVIPSCHHGWKSNDVITWTMWTLYCCHGQQWTQYNLIIEYAIRYTRL